VLVIVQTLLYMLAVGGIVAGSLGFIYFAGGAMNKARPRELRIRRWAMAAVSACVIVASAATGFVAIPAILYLASQ
jgi:hypothetical protein